jgi:isoleucyl-tRNA synthetase
VLLNDERDVDLVSSAVDAIREELNVLEVRFGTDEDRKAFGKTAFKPSFRALGQRGLGKLAQELKKAWASPTSEEAEIVLRALKQGKAMRGSDEILRDDVEVTFEPRAGIAAATDRVGSVFLDTELDEPLRDMGYARELVNRIQGIRKDQGLEYTDRIAVVVVGGERALRVVDAHHRSIAEEVLATQVGWASSASRADLERAVDVEIEGDALKLVVTRVG